MTNIITSTDIASYMPDLDTSAYSATTMSGIITQAQTRAAQFCNVNGFEFQADVDTDRAMINNKGELVISFHRRPVVTGQIQSIILTRGAFSTTLMLTDGNGNPNYTIPDPGNRMHLPNSYLYATGTYLPGGSSQLLTLKAADLFYTVNYVGGYQAIPFDLKDALLLFVQDTIARRINRSGVTSFSQGSLSMSFGPSSSDSAPISTAQQLLTQGGYVRPEIF